MTVLSDPSARLTARPRRPCPSRACSACRSTGSASCGLRRRSASSSRSGQGPRSPTRSAGSRPSASSSCSASSSPSSSSRRSARSATTRSSRFGRRKPYILIGTLLDVVFLIGIATSNTLLMVGGVRPAPAVRSNFAAGPVPGLRAGPRAAPPGRAGERDGRPVPGARRRDRDGARDDRHAHRRLHARRRSRSASSSS